MARVDSPIALNILSLTMPRKNGFEVLEWIRDQTGFKRLPVVVLTCSQKLHDMNRAYLRTGPPRMPTALIAKVR